MSGNLRIGVILPLKKTRNGRMQELLQSQDRNIEFVHIDMNEIESATQWTEKYGKLDAILHKLAHDMIFQSLGDEMAIRNMKNAQEYIKMNPNVPFIDRLENVQVLVNRLSVVNMLSSIPGTLFTLPRHYAVDSASSKAEFVKKIRCGEFPLPVLAKSFEACGSEISHIMKVISKAEDIEAIDSTKPTLYQEYVNHGGRIFKGYVLGKTILVAERSSLPDLHTASNTVEFNTQKPLPTAECFNHDHVEDLLLGTPALEEEIKAIGRAIQEKIELTLFGYDVIVCRNTKQLMVIDVNYFPSFKELTTFDPLLRDHIRDIIKQGQRS